MIEIDPDSRQTNLCRLCLNCDEFAVNIFEEQVDAEQKKTLAGRLFDFFQIKYEKSTELPNSICHQCLHVVESFTKFRKSVQKCELELQRRLKYNVKSSGLKDHQPGLNGNPGVFEPDGDCIITEVNPEQEYESSDDDFSMESDSDPDDVAPTTVLDSTRQQKSLEAASVGYIPMATDENQYSKISLSTNPSLGDSFGLENAPKNTFLCQYCDMAFTKQIDCSEHEKRHDNSAPFNCYFCPQRASSRQTLIYHIKEVHDADRPYICALCKKGFCRRSDLKKHTIVHTGVRPFTCGVCAKSFSRNTNLTKHMRIHSSDKPHVCQVCPRSFTTANELMRHSVSHADVKRKPFQCDRCAASFTRKDKLQIHLQAHLRRDTEFALNQSKNTKLGAAGVEFFSRPGDRTEEHHKPHHSATASADYPYRHSILAEQLQQRLTTAKTPTPKQSHSRVFTCDICARTFTRERDLQRHQALHLDTLFTCKQCGTGFNRREKLVRHELEHHSPQYPCSICRTTFSKQEDLETHRKVHELQQQVSGTQGAPLSQFPTREIQMPQRALAADMSFYSQMVPTMNLGFYSETRPEDRNGI